MERKPFVVGVWMEYSPNETQTGQGISRLTAWILRSMAERDDVKIVLAIAKWSETDIRYLLKEHDVSMDRVEIITSRKRTPFILQFREKLQHRSQQPRAGKRSWWRRLLRRLFFNPVVRRFLQPLLMTDSIAVAMLLIVILILLMPMILVVLLIGMPLWKLVNNRVTKAPFRLARKAVERGRQDWKAFKTEHWYSRVSGVVKAVQDNEFQLLARKAAKRNDVSLWYSPHPFATHITQTGKPIVVAIPDLIYVDFFNAFGNELLKNVDQKIRKLADSADMTISYGNDVRDRHVIRHLGVPDAQARVIRHGAVDVARDLTEEIAQFAGNSRAASQDVIQRYVQSPGCRASWSERVPVHYLQGFPFDEVPYLFVSCQVRPSKNYLNVFRAYEFLLRRRRRNLKLIITGDLSYENAGLRDFITAKGLDLDILSIPAMSMPVHAAFYHLAAVTVVPTLFEGGFPFQFSESLSVGTPVVMSNIAVVREVLPAELYERTTFDPTDPLSIAAAIEWAIDHRQALYDLQKPFYEEQSLRTWDVVADEYLQVFKEAALASGNR